MRAMILAAGRGKRMQPLSDHTPKPLLEVRGEPLIVRHIKALARAGIQEIIINLHYLGEKIEAALGNGSQWRVQLQYSPEDPVLETGGGIAKALPLLGSQPFIVVSSDIFTDFPFENLPKKPDALAHLVMVDNPAHHVRGDYGLVQTQIVFTEGPRLNFGGIGVYRPELFGGCPAGAFPLAFLFEKAILAGQATGEHYKGLWHNIGTPAQIQELNVGV
jgi:N-acetyl-alpha-D-muramate 1-phosphate uridylyltransferase